MVGHLDVPGLTADLPSSLTPATYQLLRDTYQFDGLTITDDLGAMKAVSAELALPDAVQRALAAGADVALWTSGDPVTPVLDGLERALASGALDREGQRHRRCAGARAKGVCAARPGLRVTAATSPLHPQAAQLRPEPRRPGRAGVAGTQTGTPCSSLSSPTPLSTRAASSTRPNQPAAAPAVPDDDDGGRVVGRRPEVPVGVVAAVAGPQRGQVTVDGACLAVVARPAPRPGRRAGPPHPGHGVGELRPADGLAQVRVERVADARWPSPAARAARSARC